MGPSDAGYYQEPNYLSSAKVKSQNFDLGNGDPNWLSNFANKQTGTSNDAYRMNVQGQNLSHAANDAANRGGYQAYYGIANDTLGKAQNQIQNSAPANTNQGNMADKLAAFASAPQGPSAAQAQLQKGTNQALDSQLALARSGSGFGESANALNAAGQNASSTIANAANDSATLKAQEDQNYRQNQMQALSGAAGIYGQQQQGQLSQAQALQQLAQQQSGQAEFNTNAALQGRAQNDALQQGLENSSITAQNDSLSQDLAAQGLTLQAQNAQLQGKEAEEQANAQLYGTDADVYKANLQNQVDNRNLDQQFGRDVVGGVGSAISAIGGLAMLSDERAKTNIEPTSAANRYDRDRSDTGRAYRNYETDQTDDLLDTYSTLQNRDDEAKKRRVGAAFQNAGAQFSRFSQPVSMRR